MRRPHDPTFTARWLLTICAAFGIAFLFAIATSSCAERHAREPQLPEKQVSGAELPSESDGESQLGEREAQRPSRLVPPEQQSSR